MTPTRSRIAQGNGRGGGPSLLAKQSVFEETDALLRLLAAVVDCTVAARLVYRKYSFSLSLSLTLTLTLFVQQSVHIRAALPLAGTLRQMAETPALSAG